MNKLKNKKGITLIALVVTIIVMIIIMGISVRALLGENGIINQAKYAKESTELADEKQKVGQAMIIAKNSNKFGELKENILKEKLERLIKDKEIEVLKREGFYYVIIENDRIYKIDEKGNITEEEQVP